jgi:hypothetical protein
LLLDFRTLTVKMKILVCRILKFQYCEESSTSLWPHLLPCCFILTVFFSKGFEISYTLLEMMVLSTRLYVVRI